MVFTTSKREASHDDSAWSVLWTSDDKIVSGSIDETVKVSTIFFVDARLHVEFPHAGVETNRRHRIKTAKFGVVGRL